MCKKFIKQGKNIGQRRIRRQAGFFRLSSCVVAMLVMVAAGGVYYLGLINDKATAGYRLADLEGRIFELKEINQKLELEMIELEQISRVEEEAGKLNMVLAEEISYLGDDEGLVLK